MTLEKFKDLLDSIRNIDSYIEKAEEIGLNLYETTFFDNFVTIEKILISEAYTNEGYDWISWYLYEMPHFQKKIEEEGDKKEYHAWDENDNPIDLSSDEKLWEMLEKDYGTH